MKIFIYLIIYLIPFFNFSQIEYFDVNSEILQDKREIKIQLPRKYNNNEGQSYPLILVFNGEYLFEPVAGIADYLGNWDEVPEAIIVGINQSETKNDDFQIGEDRHLPEEKGADFFDFIEIELIPLLEEKFRIAGFKIAVGHSRSGNFINYFLLRKSLSFNGYISLSPLLSKKMPDRVINALKTKKTKLFYYLANGENDFKTVKKKAKPLGDSLMKIDNPKVEISYNEIKDATHYTMVSRTISLAIESIFSVFKPLTSSDYEEKLLKSDNIIGYLEEKYMKIKDLYALEIPVKVNDILFAARAIEEKEKWDALKDLSKIAERSHPDKILGNYYRALHFEKIGKPKKAIKYYEAGAYGYKEVENITKDMMLEKAKELKELFGY
jgi:predicted alpha/beta superfamily hydrolase